MNEPTITELAWQLRSGALHLDSGLVKIYPPMVQAATVQARATIQAPRDAINKYLSDHGLQFETIEEVKKYFNRLENG